MPIQNSQTPFLTPVSNVHTWNMQDQLSQVPSLILCCLPLLWPGCTPSTGQAHPQLLHWALEWLQVNHSSEKLTTSWQTPPNQMGFLIGSSAAQGSCNRKLEQKKYILPQVKKMTRLKQVLTRHWHHHFLKPLAFLFSMTDFSSFLHGGCWALLLRDLRNATPCYSSTFTHFLFPNLYIAAVQF